jgi:hypothetical protein
MTSLIFDYETGRIFDEQDSTTIAVFTSVIDCVRQICLTFKKLELACTPERERAVTAKFIELEHEMADLRATEEDRKEFFHVSSVLWDNLIYRLRDSMLSPRHGPGATAERVSGNAKFAWRFYHERLDAYFPLFECAYPYSALDSEEAELVTFLGKDQEIPARVSLVPKTQKGPRLIVVEPCCMQYAQQGLRSILYDEIESYKVTSGHINFRDQEINQRLAMRGSVDGRLATIDLSDASDRVPRDLALAMFNAYPEFRDAIDACRSTHVSLPNGSIFGPLTKFASMGSALCFPVESMYFYTICVAALLKGKNLPVTHANVFKVSRGVWVYGDDIIVPTLYASIVLDYLQKYNCKVNLNKTFLKGYFRESCGMDSYRGTRVTPVYLRQRVPENIRDSNELVSWVSTARLFYEAGLWKSAEYLYKRCEKILGKLPYLTSGSAGLGRASVQGFRSIQRWNKKLFRFEVKAWTVNPVYRTDRLEGYAALVKSLSSISSRLPDDVVDTRHLERSALHGECTLKLRWVLSE